MSTEQYTTLGQSTLASPYTAGSGTMVLTSVASFPASGLFSVTDGFGHVWTVSAVASPNLTISIEFGTDVSLPNGTQIIEVLTARSLNQFKTDIAALALTLFPPYYKLNGSLYIAGSGAPVTLPGSSPTWINGVTPSTAGAGANGDYEFAGTGSYFASLVAAASVQATLILNGGLIMGSASAVIAGGVWVFDSSNNFIWTLSVQQYTAQSGTIPPQTNNLSSSAIALQKWTYNGSGNPAFSSTIQTWATPAIRLSDLKLSVSGTTLTAAISLNGGTLYYPLGTGTVGTITEAGYFGVGAGSNGPVIVDILSLVVS